MTRHIVAAGKHINGQKLYPWVQFSVRAPLRAPRNGRERDTWVLFTIVIAPAPSWVSLARAMRAGKGGRWRKGGMGGNGGTLHKTPIVVRRAAARCTKSPVLWRSVMPRIIAAQNVAGALCPRNAPMSGRREAHSVPLWGLCDRCALRCCAGRARAPPTYQRNELMYTLTAFLYTLTALMYTLMQHGMN